MSYLKGLTPKTTFDYVWLFDEAVDQGTSNIKEWKEKGTGLVCLKDKKPTIVYTVQPLKSNVLKSIEMLAYQTIQSRKTSNSPAIDDEGLGDDKVYMSLIPSMTRLAVAYGVVKITGTDAPETYLKDDGIVGKRLTEEIMDLLDTVSFEEQEEETGKLVGVVDLITHLGSLILNASRPTPQQLKR